MPRACFTSAISAAVLAACAVMPTGAFAGVYEPVEEAAMSETAGCPVLESTNWMAWLDMQPGSEPSLNVSGQVVLPTPGYGITAQVGPLDRRLPPAQRVVLEFAAPDGMVAQVLTTEDVQVSFPALAASYRAVIIVCGDETLAEITEIDTVQ